MKHWKKGLLAAVLLAALALGMAGPAFGSGANTQVNLMAVNETVLLELTTENMPRTVGGVLYVPYTMLSNLSTGIDLGVNSLYSATRRTVMVTNRGRKGIVFDLQANTAEDMDGNPVSARAMVRNATVFVPIDFLCEYFGTISCSRTPTPYGTLIRVTNAHVILSDQAFVDAADSLLASSLSHYLESAGGGNAQPIPSGGAETSEPPSGAELYLAFRCGTEGEECARLVEGRELRALFLFTPEQLEEQDGLVRRLVGAGHTVGLLLEGENVEDCLAQGAEGAALLAAIARYPALVASAPSLDEPGREELAKAGWALWGADVLAEDYPSGSALVRGLSPQRMNYVELDCGSGGAAFLREVLSTMGEEECQAYQPTAPALG
ncbi:MAG: hypothetical protein HDT37_07855 [Clostridiales bacterium]|nr:hypothetical protein [Clostridiales bacterium]